MSLRTKLLIVFAALGLVPLLVVCALSYRSGVGGVESGLRESADRRVARAVRRVGRALDAQESQLR